MQHTSKVRPNKEHARTGLFCSTPSSLSTSCPGSLPATCACTNKSWEWPGEEAKALDPPPVLISARSIRLSRAPNKHAQPVFPVACSGPSSVVTRFTAKVDLQRLVFISMFSYGSRKVKATAAPSRVGMFICNGWNVQCRYAGERSTCRRLW